MISTDASLARMSIELSRLIRHSIICSGTQGGVNLIRFQALTVIKEQCSLKMADFARLMNISPSTATAFADRLIYSKLVRRFPDAKNRKIVNLGLTKTGELALKRDTDCKEKFFKKMFSGLSGTDRSHLARIFSILLKANKS
jgi:DNA-binding MarR family transcriptional regulator